MKDLIGKVAVIEAPELFSGRKTLKGFEYSESGQAVRWAGQVNWVPIGMLSVLEVRDEQPALVVVEGGKAAEGGSGGGDEGGGE